MAGAWTALASCFKGSIHTTHLLRPAQLPRLLAGRIVHGLPLHLIEAGKVSDGFGQAPGQLIVTGILGGHHHPATWIQEVLGTAKVDTDHRQTSGKGLQDASYDEL